MMTWISRVTVLACVALLSGCGVGYKDLPLPGSKVRGDVYRASATFDQALNLAQGAQVKVNGVSIGRVSSVEARNYKAFVTMDLRADKPIPVDSSARLRYDTPLGELIIQVLPGTSSVDMADGGRFTREKTTTAPSVEDALQSASLLINGGNLGELQVLATELNAAFGGRERQIRESNEQLATFLTQANASSQDISAALESLSRVSVTLNEHRETIHRSLDDIGPAVKTLSKDTDEFIDLLQAADDVAKRGKTIAAKVTKPLLRILRRIGPIADAILSTRPEFHSSLVAIIAIAQQIDRTVPGDTLPLLALLHLDQTSLGPEATTGPEAAQSTQSGASDARSDDDLIGRTGSLLNGTVKGTTDPLLAPVIEGTRQLGPTIGQLLGGGR